MRALLAWESYLASAPETYVLTDSLALVWIFRLAKGGISRLERWATKIYQRPYKLIITHVPGKLNKVSDALTRCSAFVSDTNNDKFPKIMTKEAVLVSTAFTPAQIVTKEVIDIES